MELIWGKREAVYFCRSIWTTQITLNRLMKFVLWRSGLEAASSPVAKRAYQKSAPPMSMELGRTHCTFARRRNDRKRALACLLFRLRDCQRTDLTEA